MIVKSFVADLKDGLRDALTKLDGKVAELGNIHIHRMFNTYPEVPNNNYDEIIERPGIVRVVVYSKVQ